MYKIQKCIHWKNKVCLQHSIHTQSFSLTCYDFHLTLLWLGKQCRPRSDTTESGVWSGSTLFAYINFYSKWTVCTRYIWIKIWIGWRFPLRNNSQNIWNDILFIIALFQHKCSKAECCVSSVIKRNKKCALEKTTRTQARRQRGCGDAIARPPPPQLGKLFQNHAVFHQKLCLNP